MISLLLCFALAFPCALSSLFLSWSLSLTVSHTQTYNAFFGRVVRDLSSRVWYRIVDVSVLTIPFCGCVKKYIYMATDTLSQAPGSFDRSLETDQQTKTTSRCKLWSECGNGSTAWYVDGWGGCQKDLYQGEEKKGETSTSLSVAHGLQTSSWDRMQEGSCWGSI